MGAGEGIRRLALGRSSTQHPDWDELSDTWERVDPSLLPEPLRSQPFYREIDPPQDDPHPDRIFDHKGRPMEFAHPILLERQNRAMDEATEIIVTHEHRLAENIRCRQIQDAQRARQAQRFLPYKRLLARVLPTVFVSTAPLFDVYAASLVRRLLVFKSRSRMPLWTILRSDWTSLAGPLYLLSGVVFEKGFKPFLERLLIRNMSSLAEHDSQFLSPFDEPYSLMALRHIAMGPASALSAVNGLHIFHHLAEAFRNPTFDTGAACNALSSYCLTQFWATFAFVAINAGARSTVEIFEDAERAAGDDDIGASNAASFPAFDWWRLQARHLIYYWYVVPCTATDAIALPSGLSIDVVARHTRAMAYPATDLYAGMGTPFHRILSQMLGMTVGCRLYAQTFCYVLRAAGASTAASRLEADMYPTFRILTGPDHLLGLGTQAANLALVVALEVAGELALYVASLALSNLPPP